MIIKRDPQTNPSTANPDVNLVGVSYARNPGAEFGDHIKNTTCICNTSASHTYGNVMSVVEKYILDIFPKDLFKTVTTSTTFAPRQIKHMPRQLHKLEMPTMVLVPRVSFGQDDNRFLAHTLMNSRFTNTHNIWGEGSLIPLAKDMSKRIWIHGHYNRMVMYVDVIMTFNTIQEQWNYMSYIHNMIPIGHNQFIQAPLELYIPDKFCELLSGLVDIPVSDNGSVYKFLSYMNSMWYHPITYKLKGNANSDEFFMYYISNIDTVFQEPTAGQGIKDGQTRRHFEVAMSVRCEFNTIGYFTMNSPEFRKGVTLAPEDDKVVVPLFSDVINLDDFDLPVGWSVLTWPIFKLELMDDPDPKRVGERIVKNWISIDPILNRSLRAVIDHHLRIGIPMEKFIQIQFRENGQILREEMFHINWADRTLTLHHPNAHRTYRLIVTVSHDYINNLVKELFNLE